MKLKQIAASIVAAAVAFSTVAFSAFAEEAKDDKLTLLSADLTAKLQTNMVFVEGVGVVDITGADFDSSENGNADENANLDVDFDGIAYLSKDNLKTWKETGVLTLSKLKADFDTTGLKWGLFNAENAENGYVQLVKTESQPIEEGKEEEQDVVTYRGLYKIENGEIKKCCDLDTFWTATRADGVSVGFEQVNKTGTIHIYEDYSEEVTAWTELKMITTQPDGTRKETLIATNDYVTFDSSATETVTGMNGGKYWSVSTDGNDRIATFGYDYGVPYAPTEGYKIINLYEDGTKKEIYSSEDEKYWSLDFLTTFDNNNIVWAESASAALVHSLTVYSYNDETGKIDSYGYKTFDNDYEYWFKEREEDYNGFDIDFRYFSGNKFIVNLDVFSSTYIEDENNPDGWVDNGDGTGHYEQNGTTINTTLADGYTILNGLNDFDNWKSKTYYEKIVYQGDTEDGTELFRFVTKDGKTGYMDINEKVIAEFDATDDFAGKYAPVVKDGKAYLIGKDMKAVSNEIEADDVVSVAEDLFIAKKGDKTYFVTYGGEVEDPATEVVVVDYSDESSDNGITASANEGVIADGAALSVKAVTDKTDDTKVTYEISFKKADGTTVQPNGGKVTVKIPVPEKFSGKTVYVYRVEADGTYTDMNAKVENGVLVFETEHFSEYVVTTDGTLADKATDSSDSETTSSDSNSNSGADKENADTGFGGIAMSIGIAALAGAAIVVTRKKTR